jgi:diguanylate cyclase (GGDEF)-like protein
VTPGFPSQLLFRTAVASATATLGLVALLFHLRERARRDLGFFAALAIGLAAYQVLALAPERLAPSGALAAAQARSVLGMLLPAAGYLCLVAFLGLPLTRFRQALLGVPLVGLASTLALHGPARRFVPVAAGAVLFGLGIEILVALWREARRRRPDAAILFLATAILLLAALVEAATSQEILDLPGAEGTFTGPAFLVFTTLVLLAVADERQRLVLRATIDSLTGLHNRATFMDRARLELERSGRTGEPLALVMLDIDHFKAVNDGFGHPAGDRVLSGVAQSIQTTIRGIDVAGRYGGEEFVLLLVDVDEEAVVVAVERIRKAIAQAVPPKVPCAVTASAGVAIHHGRFEVARVEELVKRADAALYRSKQEGRDRTTVEETPLSADPSPAEIRYR